MTTLIFVRHGESEANRSNVFAGQIDPDLQPDGLKQAELTAKFISENYKVDKIYSSDLKRAYNTAKCLSDIINIPINKDENLREVYAGKWEGMKFLDIIDSYKEDFYMWMNDIGKAACTGGESVKSLGKRVFEAATKIAKENDGKTVVIASHATPIRAMHSMVTTGSLDEMQSISWASNASLTIFEFDNNNWKLIEASKDEHLEGLVTKLPENV